MKTISQLQNAIHALEGQRSVLGNEAVETAIAALVKEISAIQQEETHLSGGASERKLVTVLFADLSGFTALSETTDPEIVRNMINSIFECLAQVILKYGGFIEKYIGDEIMAMFGAPLSYEDHAERALRAALEMMEQMAVYNEDHRTDLDLHMGINTGMVVTGMIGSQSHQQYGVTGDTVNLAARLKQSSMRGQIFVGPETFRLTSRFFQFKSLPPISVKGKAQQQKVYQLLRRKEERVNRWGERIDSPLVGREKEMHILLKTLENLTKGHGGKLAVIGEAGIGKSRLMAEVKKRTPATVQWLEGRSLSYSRNSSFLPAQEILGKSLGIKAEHSPLEARELLSRELQDMEGLEFPATFPFLAHLMQLPLSPEEEERIKYLPAPALSLKIHDAYRQYLEAKAGRSPLVILWEDLHWADPASLRLIESLLDIPDAIPILTLLVFRPIKEEKTWKLHQKAIANYGPRYQFIMPEALSAELSARLAQNITDAETFPPEIADLIFARTEGNPFFVEELVLYWLAQGVLYQEGLEIKASEGLHDLEIPTTLQGVIASRIDQLPVTDKIVLQTASILGRIFQKDILGRLLNISAPFVRVETALSELIRHEFLRRRKSEDTLEEEFIFKHAFTYDVAYNGLLFSKRERLHEQAGEIFVALAGDAQEEFASTIAYHYERTPDTSKAIHYLELAADRARRNHVNDEAINFYGRAVEQLEKLQKEDDSEASLHFHRAYLLEKLADVQELNGHHQEAVVSFKKALGSLSANDAMTQARLLRKIGVSCSSARIFGEASTHFDQAGNVLIRIKDPDSPDWWEEWFGLQLDLMFLKYWMGRISEMKTLLERTLPEIEALGGVKQKARFYQNLVMAELQSQKYKIDDRAMEYARKMMAFSEEFEDVRIFALGKFLYGFALLAHDDLEESIEAFREGIVTANRLGDVINKIRCLNYTACAYRRLGDLKKTKAFTRQTLALADTLILMDYQASGNAQLSWIAWKEGDTQKVLEHGQKGLDLFDAFNKKLGWKTPFHWLACWPMLAVYHQREYWNGCMQSLKILSAPDQRPLEPELRPLVEKAIRKIESGERASLPKDIQQILTLAQQFKYL